MSAEYRDCRFCKQQSVVYDGGYELFKYGTRHYAHAICLAMKHGVKGGAAMIPEHQRKDYRFNLSLKRPDGWEMSRARVIDKFRDTKGERR